MALRYLASRIGVPALRRASGSRLAPPAGTRRISSTSHQGGHDNGATKPLADAELDRARAEFRAECEALREAYIKERKNRRFLIGTCCTGAGMMLLAMWYTTYKQMEKARYWRSKLLK